MKRQSQPLTPRSSDRSFTRQDWEKLTEEQREAARRLARRIKLPIPYCPHYPHARQRDFLRNAGYSSREVFFGGAAGGGKSDGLLMFVLMGVEDPEYRALIVRRTLAALKMPGGLIERSHAWLGKTAARYSASDHRWTFPSGATISFGYLEKERDLDRYQGAEFHRIAVDEAPQLPLKYYTYLFSRLRRAAGSKQPTAMGLTGNPGGQSYLAMKARFNIPNGVISGPIRHEKRLFIPSKLADNPSLDAENYIESMQELDPVTRRRLLEGDWGVRPSGGIFKREWFEGSPVGGIASQIYPRPPRGLRWARVWDTAGKDKRDSDNWAGALLAYDRAEAVLWIADVVCFKAEYPEGRRRVIETMQADGPQVAVVVEEIGTGLALAADLARDPNLAGYIVLAVAPTRGDSGTAGDAKRARAGPWASRAEKGLVRLVEGPYVGDLLDEAESFGIPKMPDDRIDAIGTGYYVATKFPARLGGMEGQVDGKPLARRGEAAGGGRFPREL